MRPVFRFRLTEAIPAIATTSGKAITVELPDSDGLGPDLQPLPDSRFDFSDHPRIENPAFGPIFVNGAQPGDALRIDFVEVKPNRKLARTLLAPNHGFLPDGLVQPPASESGFLPKPTHLYLWELRGDRAYLINTLGGRPVSVPIRPFLGCVGTANTEGPPLSTMLASNHGGNIDHPDLVEGSTLLLPVHVVGGLLYMGDMHAAQGHGETAGGGLEVSGRATVKISVKKGLTLTCPRYETSSGIACLAVEKTFEASAKMALANLIQWISSCGWNIYDASMLINQSCEFRVGGMSDSYTVVSCFVSKSSLPQDAITEISCCDALE